MMDWSDCEVVEAVPGRCGGSPVLRHTRMRADFVFENYLLGESVSSIVKTYSGLNRDDVQKAISYAVQKIIEEREREDIVRSEHALGSSKAA